MGFGEHPVARVQCETLRQHTGSHIRYSPYAHYSHYTRLHTLTHAHYTHSHTLHTHSHTTHTTHALWTPLWTLSRPPLDQNIYPPSPPPPSLPINSDSRPNLFPTPSLEVCLSQLLRSLTVRGACSILTNIKDWVHDRLSHTIIKDWVHDRLSHKPGRFFSLSSLFSSSLSPSLEEDEVRVRGAHIEGVT